MSQLMRSLVGAAVVLLLCLTMAPLGAQQGNTSNLAPDRSRAIQTQLRMIEEDRAGFVNDLLSQWAPYLDVQHIDLQSEFASVAMKVPAWQLYGASLVGDFETMARILTGAEGAGPYINALSEPQQKVASGSNQFGVGTNDLGSTTDSLVYVPIPPCRVIDTRIAGAKTGVMAVGVPRTFDLEAQALSSGQGGAASCTGLPSFSHYGWAANVTVVGATGDGYLKIWPYGGSEPNASVLNYGTTPYAVANGLNLTGCYACAEDINVQAYGYNVHVIVDVMGYYRSAVVSAGAMTRLAGTVVSMAAGAKNFVVGGTCPSGTVLVGGELDHNGLDVAMGEMTQDSLGSAWQFWMINNSASTVSVTAYSRCMDSPVKLF